MPSVTLSSVVALFLLECFRDVSKWLGVAGDVVNRRDLLRCGKGAVTEDQKNNGKKPKHDSPPDLFKAPNRQRSDQTTTV
jgi:hypothetical protein